MNLPNYAQAVVPERKITEYLLSLTHRDGRSKAAFFMRFSFTADNWEGLADALRRHAAEHEIIAVEDTPTTRAGRMVHRNRREYSPPCDSLSAERNAR